MGACGQQRLVENDRLWQSREEDRRESRVREKWGERGCTSSLSRIADTHICSRLVLEAVLDTKDRSGNVPGSAILFQEPKGSYVVSLNQLLFLRTFLKTWCNRSDLHCYDTTEH